MSEREVGSLLLLAGALVFLLPTVWARRGRSYRARSWMYTPAGSLRTERMVIFGGPTCGLGLLALAAIALPPHAFGLALLGSEVAAAAAAAGFVLLILLVLPLLYWVLLFIPMPDFLYPRWAREVREDRRKFPQTAPHQPPHPKDQRGSGSR